MPARGATLLEMSACGSFFDMVTDITHINLNRLDVDIRNKCGLRLYRDTAGAG